MGAPPGQAEQSSSSPNRMVCAVSLNQSGVGVDHRLQCLWVLSMVL